MNARKMGRRWLVMMMAMVVVMAGIGVAVAWAQQAPSPAGPCARPQGLLTSDDREAIGQMVFQRVKEKLSLSDQQAEQMRTMLRSRRDEARADFLALCEARVQLRQVLAQQNSDPSALKATADQIKALQGKLLDRRLETAVALRSQLSADQWTKWIELRKTRGRHWMGRAPAMGS